MQLGRDHLHILAAVHRIVDGRHRNHGDDGIQKLRSKPLRVLVRCRLARSAGHAVVLLLEFHASGTGRNGVDLQPVHPTIIGLGHRCLERVGHDHIERNQDLLQLGHDRKLLSHVIGDTRRHSLDNVLGGRLREHLLQSVQVLGHTFPLARGAVALTVRSEIVGTVRVAEKERRDPRVATDSHEVGVNAIILGPEVNGAAPVGDDVGHTLRPIAVGAEVAQHRLDHVVVKTHVVHGALGDGLEERCLVPEAQFVELVVADDRRAEVIDAAEPLGHEEIARVVGDDGHGHTEELRRFGGRVDVDVVGFGSALLAQPLKRSLATDGSLAGARIAEDTQCGLGCVRHFHLDVEVFDPNGIVHSVHLFEAPISCVG